MFVLKFIVIHHIVLETNMIYEKEVNWLYMIGVIMIPDLIFLSLGIW